METVYSPDAIESRWYNYWCEHSLFSPEKGDEPYSIMIPPPNVTGTLHMGHAFQHTIIDLMIRHQRMMGKKSLWQMGTDHAGIATQMVVERQLKAEGTSSKDIGREAFLKRVGEWKEHSVATIETQIKRMGSLPDWSNPRFTMDPDYQRAVRQAFIRMYKDGLIYRDKKLVNWDPHLLTSISDLEVINKEEEGKLYTVRYPFVEGGGHMLIATTRPETILADGALAISPGDSRYQHLVGKEVMVPMTTRKIAIIEDSYVDPEFGTGCVKITPAHDFNDFKVGTRHIMEVINLFHPNASMNDNAPEAYRGMDRFEAREAIVRDLEKNNLLEKVESHIYKRPYGDRSGVVIEPYFTDQWYVNAKDLAVKAIEVVRDGSIEFVPKRWEKVYFNWMENIEDWCISRQLWWGHRIPAWHDTEGNIYVGDSEEQVRQENNVPDSTSLRQDDDVLDTWFSSGLWTFASLGWPEKTQSLQGFHPTSVLVTGFDIIFFWVARMIMMSTHLLHEIPFKTVYVHGLVRDSDGQKMSKSKGNVIDPIDIVDGIGLEDLVRKRTSNMMQPELALTVEKLTRKQFPEGIDSYGVDALRMTFASLASTGRDIRFDVGRIEGYKHFCNKLWNACRFVLMQTEDYSYDVNTSFQLSYPDKWMNSRLQHTIKAVATAIETYRFDLAAQAIYECIWHEYCDWYLELTKPLLQSHRADASDRHGCQRTLLLVLDSLLRMLHPFMPFITEELWQTIKERLGKADDISIMYQPYPQEQNEAIDLSAEEDILWIQQLITASRSLRSEYRISPKRELKASIISQDSSEIERCHRHKDLISALAGIPHIEVVDTPPKTCLLLLVGNSRLYVPMEGLVDLAEETQRLEKENARLDKEVKRIQGKLNNEKFTSNAPSEVIEKEQTKLTKARQDINRISSQLQLLKTS